MRAGIIGRSTLAAAAAGLCCLGCTSSGARMQRFVGRPVAELVADRGPADRIVLYPYGGHVYIWEREQTAVGGIDATGRRAAVGDRRDALVYREMALVGDDGVIIRTYVENTPSVRGST
jgi:hypothetical protein